MPNHSNNPQQILILEDERIVAATIAAMLEDMGHTIVGVVHSVEQAKQIPCTNYNLAVLDVNLGKGGSGLDFAAHLMDIGKSFFFLTSYSDAETVQMAKRFQPGAYVIKPFTESDLFVAVEMSSTEPMPETEPTVLVNKGHTYTRLPIKNIRYLRAENIYVEIYTEDKMWLKRAALKELLDELQNPDFLQTHRSYAVNLKHCTGWSSMELHLQDARVPVSRRNWDEVKQYLQRLGY